MSRFIAMVALMFFTLLHPGLSISEDSLLKAGASLGEVKTLGNGVIWSWVECDNKGTPMAIGVTFTETALTGLPETVPPTGLPGWEYTLALPKMAGIKPFDHIGLDWNPKGHIPPGIYDLPHFDIHFYFISPREREKITAKGEDIDRLRKKPSSKFIPKDYILPEGTEHPRMGVHWIDSSAPELNQQTFTKTFIYGSYNGEVTFIEPMITKAFIETKSNIREMIKLPDAYQKPGYYPTAYSLRHDPVRHEYTVSLEGLKLR